MQTTQGHLLGGRIDYAQPADGYRTGIEPVLLAASVPARPGQRILEAGTGAGAGLLCLNARVSDLQGIGVEIDPAMAELARQNVRRNRFERVEIVTGDITSVTLGPFDHAFANPPWHDPRATRSPIERRRLAKQETGADLERWIQAVGRMLAPGGSFTLILPPSLLERARLAAHASGFGFVETSRLLAKADRPAKLALVQAWLGTEIRDSEASATVLHAPDGSFMPDIEAVLRDGAAMPCATAR